MINTRSRITDRKLDSNVNSTSPNLSSCITTSILRVMLSLSQFREACFANVTFTHSPWRHNQEEQQKKLIAFAQGARETAARRNRRPSNKSTCLVLIRLRSRASVPPASVALAAALLFSECTTRQRLPDITCLPSSSHIFVQQLSLPMAAA